MQEIHNWTRAGPSFPSWIYWTWAYLDPDNVKCGSVGRRWQRNNKDAAIHTDIAWDILRTSSPWLCFTKADYCYKNVYLIKQSTTQSWLTPNPNIPRTTCWNQFHLPSPRCSPLVPLWQSRRPSSWVLASPPPTSSKPDWNSLRRWRKNSSESWKMFKSWVMKKYHKSPMGKWLTACQGGFHLPIAWVELLVGCRTS